MKEVMYNSNAKEVLEALSKGAFLNVSDGIRDNTMTIAWGSIGFIWKKPIFMVMVRHARYTHELIENADSFSVSIPLTTNLQSALGICGSKSGRDLDKFQAAGLTKLKAHKVNAPLIGECDLHFECKIVGKQKLTQEVLLPELDTAYYSNGDYHTLYYGEIMGTYER